MNVELIPGIVIVVIITIAIIQQFTYTVYVNSVYLWWAFWLAVAMSVVVNPMERNGSTSNGEYCETHVCR